MMASELLEKVNSRIDSKQRYNASYHFKEIVELRDKAKQLMQIIAHGDRNLTDKEKAMFEPNKATHRCERCNESLTDENITWLNFSQTDSRYYNTPLPQGHISQGSFAFGST